MTKTSFYHPKFWPTWILILFIWVSAKIPFAQQLFIGKILGKILYIFLKKQKKIAFTNLSHCFCDKTHEEIQDLNKDHFEALGISVFEIANSFFASNKKINNITTINNQHYLTDALNKNKNIILLIGHFTPLMLGGRALLSMHSIASIYRPQNNKLFDYIMHKKFTKNGAIMIKNKNVRMILKAIKSGMPVWYVPDQDAGVKNTIFAPFFNIQTATVSATSRLAQIPNTVIIPFFFIRVKNTYQMYFEKPLQDYPSGDSIKDATTTNKILEKQVLSAPEQYLWIHRRFKTRPKGEKPFY